MLHPRARWFLVVAALAACCNGGARAQAIYRDDVRGKEDPSRRLIPFAFYSESLEFGLGVGGKISRAPQEHTGNYAGMFGTTNGSFGLFLATTDLGLAPRSRWFIDAAGSIGRYPDLRAYVDGNPLFPDERAGSNDSNPDDIIEGSGRDNWVSARFKYVLPVGDAREAPVPLYVLHKGLLPGGGERVGPWNPSRSGITRLDVTVFYHYRRLEPDSSKERFNTNGINVGFSHDHRDLPLNPSRGSFQRIGITRDFGALDSSASYTFVELDLRKYISLGATRRTLQRVLALWLWTADTPTWTVVETPDGPRIENRPPYYRGATLGGLSRFRGYTTGRFNDKAAILGAAEFRVIPAWQPVRGLRGMNRLKYDWWQFVVFAEVGRVAPRWSFEEWGRDLKYDGGLGIRFKMSRTVLRADLAVSPEEWALKVMVGQTF